MISPVLRPTLWSALLGAVAAAALATPSYADPAVPTSVPDTGLRPTVTGTLQLPGGAAAAGAPAGGAGLVGTPGSTVGGPLAAQIYAAETRVGQLGDQLLLLRQKRAEAQTQRDSAATTHGLAQAEVTRAQENADTAAATDFKAAAALPPGEFAGDLHEINQLSRIVRGESHGDTTTAAAGALARARANEQAAHQALVAAESRLKGAEQEYAAAEKVLRDEEAKLAKLRRDNAAQLIEIERQQELAEQRLGAGYLNESANGLVAHPTALAAVAYAKAQLGDPYLWGAEGPDRFDCSGLVWAAYRSAGYYGLPRVARDQYYATRSRTVARTALLPGDLLFFASGTSWTTIHHMGMYVGGGKMIHAPTTGDVVKISTVRWSRLYAATRVIGAVPAPATTPPPQPAPKPPATSKPTPKPTSPWPKPTPPTPKPTSPWPTPTTPTPTPTSPSPTPTSPSPTPTASTSTSSTGGEPSSPTDTSGSGTASTAASSTDPEGTSSASTSASTGS